MKSKTTIILLTVFFVIINTIYFWEGKVSVLILPTLLILGLFGLFLVIRFFKEFYIAYKERFKNKKRLFLLGLFIFVFSSILFFPNGIIPYYKFESKDLLVAQQEGVANCMTTLKLKENNKFKYTSYCFGVTEAKGNYKIKNDTIFFDYQTTGRYDKYKYGIIELSDSVINLNNFVNVIGTITLFNDKSEGYELSIIKNDLHGK